MEIKKGTDEDPVAFAKSILLLNNSKITSVIQGNQVVKIGGVFMASPASTYKFDTITKIRIDTTDGFGINFELQDVSNQLTWNTGTQAALDQAIIDLNDFLRT